MPDKISQPKDAEVKAQLARARLVWRTTFAKDNNERFSSVQKFIDSECIRLMGKYTPMRSGLLMKSAVLGTKLGSGSIFYASPYARYQYYGVVYGPNIPIFENGKLVGFRSPPKKYPTDRQLQYSKARHPLAQRLWFETMKHNHKEAILRGAARIAKGGK